MLDGLLSGVHNEYFMKNNIPTQLDNLTNQDSEIISVDILTNHVELSDTADNNSDNGSTVNCYPDRQKSVCMKTKLSPASETHPQNNHAFNTGEDPVIINTCSYGGARPKIPLHSTYTTNQTVTDESIVIGVTVNSNHVSNSKHYTTHENGAKTVSCQNETNVKSQVSDCSVHGAKSPVVGDYFFTNGDPKESRKKSVKSESPDSVHKHVPSFVDRFIRSDKVDNVPRWADPACQGIKFADDDDQSVKDLTFEGNIVFDSSQVLTPTSDSQKRLYLEGYTETEAILPDDETVIKHELCDHSRLSNNRKLSKDESLLTSCDSDVIGSDNLGYINQDDNLNCDREIQINGITRTQNDFEREYSVLNKRRKSSLLSEVERLDITQSLPSSPLHRLHKPDSPTIKLKEEVMRGGKCKHHSPLFKRKSKYPRSVETSEDDFSSSSEDVRLSYNYKNLESFQKAQLKHKVRFIS
jgi:hypothetical protein